MRGRIQDMLLTVAAVTTALLSPATAFPDITGEATAPKAPPTEGPKLIPSHRTVMQDVQEHIGHAGQSFKDVLQEMSHHSTLAGGMESVVSKLHLTRAELAELAKSLKETVHVEDLAMFVALGWLSLPAIQLPYRSLPVHMQKSLKYWYKMTHFFLDHVQQAAKIAVLVYLLDIFKIICIGMGFDFCKMHAFPHAFCQAAYALWGSNRLMALKRYYIRRFVNEHPELYGRMQILDRLSNAALGGMTGFVILNILKVKMGVAVSSLLAFSGAGTVAFGLASKGLATQVLNGLMLASSDRIYEGDSVRFGNGKAGTIVKLGWMETVLRGQDDILVSIPNTDLVNQPVSNLSRIRHSQVKQNLRFNYADRKKLPEAIKAIKEEVRLACPKLVSDGSRPFRAHWTDFQPGFVEVVLDFHFHIRPDGDEYWDNRQRVLLAIDSALSRLGLDLKN